MINLANIYEFWIFPPFVLFDNFVRFVHIVVSLINFFLPIIKKKKSGFHNLCCMELCMFSNVNIRKRI